MEKKNIIITLSFVAFIVVCAIALIIILGITAREYNWVLLEVNPKVEFLCNKNNKIVSFRALNEDAEVILSDVEYIGLDIATATTDFLDLCARCGYIDVDGESNAVNVTIIDGITQALDVHVMEHINSYLKSHEIMCAVCENYEDRNISDEKKKNNVSDSNKYKLIKTISQSNPTLNTQQLKKLSEIQLIDMVANMHKYSTTKIDDKAIKLKGELLDINMGKYQSHMQNINNKTQQDFAKNFDKFQRTTAEKYRINFEKEFNNWQQVQVS